MRSPRLLIVEDDDVFRTCLVSAFEDRGYEVSASPGFEDARSRLEGTPKEEDRFTHALLDIRLEDGTGTELIPALRKLNPNMRIVVLTGYGSIATAVKAVQEGATHYLSKPADADDIEAAWEGKSREQVASLAKDTGDHSSVPSLARVEWEHIHRVLEDCGGNISRAAELLGIHRRSLQRKLAKYPLPR